MDILVTGAEGFVGKNLVLRLRESPHFIISTYSRGDSFETLKKLLTKADAVIHLAGENRPIDDKYFNICFHGHYPHLFKFEPFLKKAIEEFDKSYKKVCLKVKLLKCLVILIN